jgi:hypothetical protein
MSGQAMLWMTINSLEKSLFWCLLDRRLDMPQSEKWWQIDDDQTLFVQLIASRFIY